MIKTVVSSARNVVIRLKKLRFLKLFLIFAGIKQGYNIDYQYLAHNAKNRRFLSIERQRAGKYRLYVCLECSFC